MKPKFHIFVWLLLPLLILSAGIPAVALYLRGYHESLFLCIPAVLCSVLTGLVFFRSRQHRIRYIAQMNDVTNHTELSAVRQLPFGMCVVNEDGTLLHFNRYFASDVMRGGDLFGKRLYDMVSLPSEQPEQKILLHDRYFKVTALPYQENGIALTAYLWEDVTELENLHTKYEQTRPNVMVIMVDNYDDLIQNAKESAKLETSVAVEKLLENFVAGTNGILRRIKADKFLAVVEEQHLQEMIDGKFRLLDDARAIHVDEKNCVTFSIGVGHGAASMQESEQIAMKCLDMAMGRGGDQAVVNTAEGGYHFFGGVSKGVEKRSRSKTRATAGAIQDLITASENVLIMGHRFGDLDSVGAACGLAGAIREMGVPVHVVVDPVKNLSRQLLDMMCTEIGGEMFLTPAQGLDELTDQSLLIIVDTHNKDILESDKLYQEASRVVVIDHHRKTVNFVDNALVFYHEPYASSACEMVTELLQYFKLGTATLESCFADCLLAGITLDTKNFVMRTGVRTFEAAAYLRKQGADTVKVKCLFSGSIDSYRSRSEIVGSAEITGCYAIAAASSDASEIRLVAPQAADELLSIQNVSAAFVIYEIGKVVNISARSLGAVNVQVIMEMLGGGGHQTMAATQLYDSSVEEAKEKLLAAIAEREKQNQI